MLDEILEFNKQFVANKGYEKYITNKYPDKKIAILSCMDTRLTELLPAALGIKNGDVKMIKNAGGPGSHNGMKSVIQNIKDKEFTRIRVGIGKPENKSDMIKYVIGNVSESDKKILDEATTIAKDAVIEILENGVDKAMNKYN